MRWIVKYFEDYARILSNFRIFLFCLSKNHLMGSESVGCSFGRLISDLFAGFEDGGRFVATFLAVFSNFKAQKGPVMVNYAQIKEIMKF